MGLQQGWKRWTVAASALLLTAACSLPGAGHSARHQGGGTVGSIAPDFRLVGLDGQPHSLSEYRGHVVLVNFWATWCIPCRAEIAELETTYKKRQAQGVVFLGVDWKEGGDTVQPFVDERRVTYQVLLDKDGSAYSAYQVAALPQTFVLDRKGRIVVARTGLATREKFDQELKAAGA